MKDPVDYFDSESLRKDLKGKTVRGGVATSIAQAASIVIGLIAIPVLARLLDPADFGLVAMVAVFAGLAPMFIDAGLSMATVQREKISPQQVTNLFWIATAAGCLVALTLAALALPISYLYGEPRLVAVTLAFSCQFALSGLAIQHQALLRRAMLFNRLAITEVASQVIGQAAGIVWAWCFWGEPNDYFALVLIPIGTALSRMVLVWLACAWRPGLPRRGAGTREMVEFGANLLGFSLINYFARNGDKLLIGWWWGATPLGYYERSFTLLLTPLRKIMPPLSAVVVPALSRLKDQPELYRNAYRSAVTLAAWIAIPSVGLLAAVCEPLVLLVLGPNWGGVAPVFEAMIPAAWATSFVTSYGWAYTSWGHVHRQMRWAVVDAFAALVAVAVSLPYGIVAVAWTTSVVYCFSRLPSYWYCFLGTPLRLSDVGRPISRPTMVAACAFVAVRVCDAAFGASTQLVTGLCLLAAIYAATAVLVAAVLPGARVEIAGLLNVIRSGLRPSSLPVSTPASPAAEPNGSATPPR